MVGFAAVFVSAILGVLASMVLSGRGDHVMRTGEVAGILAYLSHPNIARLLDAGHVDDGRPFFAMEFVKGIPLDEFCNQLPLRRQLEIFEILCGTVVYAHRMLVVHRDIKPSNILVDANGSPKLLDFGIARLLDEAAAAGSTVTGECRLTPQYASPEQVQGLPVAAAADIFSLCALLYRLITGRSAFRPDYSTRSELERAICRDIPRLLSRWNQKADKELDAIISKAIGHSDEALSSRKDWYGIFGQRDRIIRALFADL